MCIEKNNESGKNLPDVVEILRAVNLELQKNNEKLKEEILRLKEDVKRLEGENKWLEKENVDIQNSHMKLYNDTKDEIRELKAEIERLGAECWKDTCEDCEESGLDIEALIMELQDQHQQDCIRYNDMRTAFLKTVDELAMLRKHFGVGQ